MGRFTLAYSVRVSAVVFLACGSAMWQKGVVGDLLLKAARKQIGEERGQG